MEYVALTDGRIVGKRGKFLKLIKKKNGYLHFSQSEGAGKPNQTLVHRFVWEYFNGPIPEGLVVDHIDGDRCNNSLHNLQLLSPKDNVRKSESAKLTGFTVFQIKKMLDEGGITQTGISKIFGVSPQLICDIKMGRRWSDIKESD